MKKKKIYPIIRIMFLFVCFALVSFATQAQSPAPAANMSGPLKATAYGGNIAIKSQIAFGYQNPTLTYTLQNNTSGASIVSNGTYTYDAATGEGTQSIIINPGTTSGGFTVILDINGTSGTAKCSKSVTVSEIAERPTRNNPSHN